MQRKQKAIIILRYPQKSAMVPISVVFPDRRYPCLIMPFDNPLSFILPDLCLHKMKDDLAVGVLWEIMVTESGNPNQ